MERKGFGIRFGAYIIDVIIITAASMVLVPMLLFAPIVGVLLLLVIPIGYAIIEIMTARSPAKMMLGLIIRQEDGSPATREQLIKRTLIKFSPSLVGNILGALGLLTGVVMLANLSNIAALVLGITLLALSSKPLQTVKQTFWDIQAKTAVFGKGVSAQGFAPIMPGAAPTPPTPGMPPTAPPPPQA